MKLERQFSVAVSPAVVWELLWDIPELASCIPGCLGAREEAPRRYAAVVEVVVGRFRSHFDLSIDVLERVEGELVKARAQGRDRITRSTMVADLEFRVASAEDGGALVSLENDVQVLGRLGSLGHAVVKRRSEDLMDEFAQALQERLTQGGDSPSMAGPTSPVVAPATREVGT